ncbi:hypothetical protein DPMN_111185 [Dreissena polymorpha]|uniref:Uncharacterized protein n=1 Tax=Dreissena polymorpha TaxID=45954 RepID=A0A9D4KE50_DREPO|nr:hypothetical protein DPMN_111185 [Dreissena polymorpha]
MPPPTGGHVFSPIWTVFKLVRHINKTNVLINFHDDWAKIVTSRVFTRFLYSHIRKTAPPTWRPCFSTDRNPLLNSTNISLRQTFRQKLHEDWALNVTSTVFDLNRDIIETNLLTKFHEDRTINVASRVFANKCGRTMEKDQSQKLT